MAAVWGEGDSFRLQRIRVSEVCQSDVVSYSETSLCGVAWRLYRTRCQQNTNNARDLPRKHAVPSNSHLPEIRNFATRVIDFGGGFRNPYES